MRSRDNAPLIATRPIFSNLGLSEERRLSRRVAAALSYMGAATT